MSRNVGYNTFQNEDGAGLTHTDGGNVQVAGSIPPVAFSSQPPAPGHPRVVYEQPGVPLPSEVVSQLPTIPPIPGCPPGLEYLVQIDQVLVHQHVDLMEGHICTEFENYYTIKNSVGQEIFLATEESECCNRVCCCTERGFVFHITDITGQEVMRVIRLYKCCAGCCWCATEGSHCSLFLAVESPPGNVIGYVRQTKSWASPHFDILTADDQCVLKIRGPWCQRQTRYNTDDIEYKLLTNDLGTQVGSVSKQYGGWAKEFVTTADNFGLRFPMDLDVKVKATILASTFLIDFMFSKNKKRKYQCR